MDGEQRLPQREDVTKWQDVVRGKGLETRFQSQG